MPVSFIGCFIDTVCLAIVLLCMEEGSLPRLLTGKPVSYIPCTLAQCATQDGIVYQSVNDSICDTSDGLGMWDLSFKRWLRTHGNHSV